MTELKTLKDLNYEINTYGEIIQKEIIRAEAVKWVKYDRLNYEIRFGSVAHQIINNWIKRFNLTEEDLL